MVLHTTLVPELSGSLARRTLLTTRLPPIVDPAIRNPVPLTTRSPVTEVSITSHHEPGGTIRSPRTMTALSCWSLQVRLPVAGMVTVARSGRLASESAVPAYTAREPVAVSHC